MGSWESRNTEISMGMEARGNRMCRKELIERK